MTKKRTVRTKPISKSRDRQSSIKPGSKEIRSSDEAEQNKLQNESPSTIDAEKISLLFKTTEPFDEKANRKSTKKIAKDSDNQHRPKIEQLESEILSKIEQNRMAIEQVIGLLREIRPDQVTREMKEDLIRIHLLASNMKIRLAHFKAEQERRKIDKMLKVLHASQQLDTKRSNNNNNNPIEIETMKFEMTLKDAKFNNGEESNPKQSKQNENEKEERIV
ncbi:hypothetical protein SSS_08577 [Sarcoptes scabiei]|uniref:Uncharacterized protein n=1 Tax=Sarcoptes scabiei TaxID=52283 RepID=A0A132A062_SARSC|nr:hypothetical protein SSS_08577 [Sarcoptes scabiei]KPM04323.1 hypothetical protein QR98_0027660 [Sarcoptes scabiei]